MTNAPLISFDQVCFSYRDHRVINNLSFTIEAGQFVCLLGANGSGKSTIARLIDALIVPDAGTISVAGYDTTNTATRTTLRQNIGMVFQNPDDQLVASLVEDEVAFGPENIGVHNPELRTRVTQALTTVGLAGYEKHSTLALSGGQKQRVALAGALAMQPRLLILDEASSMLDKQGRTMVIDLCKQLHQQGMTIVMITHFIDEAAHADRVMVLDNGRLAADGSPADVLTQTSMLASKGLVAPFALRLSQALRDRGLDIQPTLTTHALKENICRWHANK